MNKVDEFLLVSYPIVCLGCNLIRMGEIDTIESERNCHSTARDSCPSCSCPFAIAVPKKSARD